MFLKRPLSLCWVFLFLGVIAVVSCQGEPAGCLLPVHRECGSPAKVWPKPRVPWPFTEQEGFVSSEQMLSFLLAEKLVDTVYMDYRVTADTLGKYYAFDTPDHVLFCLLDEPGIILLELRNKDGYIQLENTGRYNHGNYDCCWDGYDGFVKYGDLFGLKICGTGSGYCGSWLYLFKEFEPEFTEPGIQLSCWTGYGDELAHRCTSSVKKVPAGLAVTYQCQEDTLAGNTWKPYGPKSTYTVYYRHTAMGWEANDSSRIQQDLWL